MADQKTYTEEELAKIKQEVADASFKAGLTKAQADRQAQANSQEQEEKAKRLAELEKAEETRLAQAELNSTVEALKAEELKGTGLKGAGLKRFANENQETLKGLTGEELASKVKEIRESANEDDQALFFENAEVNASGSLQDAGKGEKQPEYKYIPGSSIRIKN